MMFGSSRFGMFAKFWEPGRVKTRLATAIGPDKAAEVYKAFLDAQVLRFAELSNSVIVFSSDDRVQDFRHLIDGRNDAWQLQTQGDGDLGERMQRFFLRAFEEGYERAALVGSDTPTLPLTFIRQADALLRIHDVVLGPTEDGGYYLVAARQHVPPIFSSIEWSTPDVWRQTIGKLQEHRVRFAVLPTWYDIDDAADLQRLRLELGVEGQDGTLVQLRQQLDSILGAL